jgi:hypothetical protein
MAFLDYVGDERLKGLYGYWVKHWKGSKLPGRQDIDPIAMGAAVLPLLLLTEVVRGEGQAYRLRYRLVGSEIEARFNSRMTGRFIDELMHGQYLSYIVQLYADAIERRAAVYSESAYQQKTSATFTKRLLMPLSSDGKVIDLVMGAQVFYIDPQRFVTPVSEIQEQFEGVQHVIDDRVAD